MKMEPTKPICSICGQASSLLFSAPCDYRKPDNSKEYKVYWCNSCSYGEIWERPTREQISGFYELSDYYTHHGSTMNIDSGRNNEGFLDRLRMHISWRIDRGEELKPEDAITYLKGDSRKMLEIGCGNGKNLLKFIDKGFTVEGVEPDPVARNTARNSGLKVFEGTAEELPQEVLGEQYDVVLMSHVMEHCLDINAAVANVKKMLKHRGVFIVETPNCEAHGFKDYQAAWPWTDIPRHLNFFTPPSLNSVLLKHDFKVVSEKYRGFCRQFSSSWLRNEEDIWCAFAANSSKPVEKPSFKLRNWKLLFKSLLSGKPSKYDSVRLVAISD